MVNKKASKLLSMLWLSMFCLLVFAWLTFTEYGNEIVNSMSPTVGIIVIVLLFILVMFPWLALIYILLGGNIKRQDIPRGNT